MFEGLFQPMHLLIILGLALLFFGPKRLPELGKGLGTSIRDFRDALSGGHKPDPNQNQAQAQAPVQHAGHLDAGAASQPYVQQAPPAQAAYAPPPPAQQAEAPRPPANTTGS